MDYIEHNKRLAAYLVAKAELMEANLLRFPLEQKCYHAPSHTVVVVSGRCDDPACVYVTNSDGKQRFVPTKDLTPFEG